MKLLISAITKMVFGVALIGAMLFLPAWTFNYLVKREDYEKTI